MEAIFTIDEHTVGIWQIEFPDGNWMAVVNEQAPGEFHGVMRFRWYRDDKAFNSSDVKRSYEMTTSSVSTQEVIEKMRAVVEQIRGVMHARTKRECPTWELLRGARTPDELMEALAGMPGINMLRVISGGASA